MNYIRLQNVDLDLPVGRQAFSGFFKPVQKKRTDERVDTSKGPGYVHALRDVTLDIKAGDRVGLIGVNGAGKSTLLRVLAGIYAPTKGRYEANGRISTLFVSGVGMNQNASGRENIFLCSRTLGMSRAEIRAIEQEIVDFAEIGDFIDLPIRTYSAGMKTRLGFAVATAIRPEILLIDEVFGVGDSAFRLRANERIQKVVGQAGILVLATHADATITNFCDLVCWMDKGEVRYFGPAEEGIEAYREATHGAPTKSR